jgi:lipoate-protein ligase A
MEKYSSFPWMMLSGFVPVSGEINLFIKPPEHDSMKETWRLIIDPPAGGAYNMAVDTATLSAADQSPETFRPTLRLYEWESPTLSLGLFQNDEIIDRQQLALGGIDSVRRPTGGRALLHGTELTYSITIPSSSKFYGSLATIYEFSASAIRYALKTLSIPIDEEVRPFDNDGSGANGNPLCANTITRHEISSGGRKIVASAQRRVKNAAMQHGSIFLSFNVNTYCNLFAEPHRQDPTIVGALIGGINDYRLAQKTVRVTDIATTLITAFHERHDLELEPGSLNFNERFAVNAALGSWRTARKTVD